MIDYQMEKDSVARIELGEDQMLAAATAERDRFPTLFYLAIEILRSDRQLPSSIATQLRELFVQALEITRNPSSVEASTDPDSIQLALELKESVELRKIAELGVNSALSTSAVRDFLARRTERAAAS